MLVPIKLLKDLAASADPVSGQVLIKFIAIVEEHAEKEIEAAKKTLSKYGYKVYEDQHHTTHELE